MVTFLLWASGIVLVGGVANLLWMLRESRVGIHPTCRQCGYDLRGIWRRIYQCPECGGDVRIVSRGHWKFDWRMILGPVLLLLLGLSLGGVALAPRIHKALATPPTPTATLLANTLSFDRKIAAAAFVELQKRRTEGKLSSTETLLFTTRLSERATVERLVRQLPETARTVRDAKTALLIWNQLIRMGVNAPQPAVEVPFLKPEELTKIMKEAERLPEPVEEPVEEFWPAPKPPVMPDSKPTGRFEVY